MRIQWLEVVAALLLAFIPVDLLLAQDDGLLHIESEDGTYAWILHEESGRLFATSSSKDEVIEFDAGTGKETRRFSVGAEPKELLIKRDFLIAGSSKSPSLTIIDLTTNKIAGSVELVGNGSHRLFCSRADNLYVYAICNTGTSSDDCEVLQIDLKDQRVRNRVNVGEMREQEPPRHIAMSSDGYWIGLRPIARGASLMRVDEEACTFTPVRGRGDSFGQLVAGPSNRYWTLGNELYPLDFEALIRKFKGSSVAIHPYLDIVASFKTKGEPELWIEKFSIPEVIKSMKLGPQGNKVRAPAPPAGDPPHGVIHDPHLQFDAARSRVVCAWGKHAYVFSLSALDPKMLHSRLTLDTASIAHITIGDTLRSRLKVTNAELAPLTHYELVSAPQGAKVVGTELVWKPTAGAVGRHKVVIKATCGDVSDSVDVTVDVYLPPIPLGFVSMGLNVDPSGKFAIVWGTPSDGPSMQPRDPALGPVNYVVIDLEKQKIVIQERLTAGVKSLSVDDKFVYHVPTQGNLIYRISLSDVSDRKRLFLNAPVTRIYKLPQGAVAVQTQPHQLVEVRVYDRETFRRLPSHVANRVIESGQFARHPIKTMSGNTIRLFESIVDLQSGEIRCLVDAAELPSLVTAIPAGRNRRDERDERGRDLWGRRLSPEGIMTREGRLVAGWSSHKSDNKAIAFSQSRPLAILLRQEALDRTQQRLVMEQRDLLEAGVVRSEVLDWAPRENYQIFDHYTRHCQLQTAGNMLVATDGRRVYIRELGPQGLEGLPQPLHFNYPRIPLASVENPFEFKLRASGGKGKKMFALVGEMEGVHVNESTGVVQIDMPTLWKRFVDNFAKQVNAAPIHPSRAFNAGDLPAGRFIEDACEQFKLVMGDSVPEGQLPVTVPLQAVVTDDEGQQDRQIMCVVAFGPREQLEDVVAAVKKQVAENSNGMRLRAEQRRIEMEKKRLDDLEKRARRIEAALEAIQEKLDERGSS